MTRLTGDQKREYRAWFEQFRKPSRMVSRATALMRVMGDVDLFNQAGVDFITEAKAAGQFAGIKGADAVRLVPDRERWPDFELHFEDRREPWEFTEADLPERRRGDEYRQRAERIAAGGLAWDDDPVEKWAERAERIPTILEQRCAAKAAMGYSGAAALLVYLNIGEYGIRQREIETSFQKATAVAKDAFTSVWVLWKARAYHVWQHGRPVGPSLDA